MGDRLVRELLTRCTFPPAGTPVVCAVSGGADSLSLLVLAVEAGCVVTAVHVDHGLREGSTAEARIVEETARRYGASFRAERVTVEPGPNLEARARAARYAVLPPDALLGHTADDQAETVLLNLLRGAGLEGLAGMRRDGRRPLLDLRRSETRALCAELGLEVVEDPMNLDPSLRRNRVRTELLPLLADLAGRDVVPLLCRQADLVRAAAELLDELASGIDPTDARALAGAPPVMSAVAVRNWLRGCSPEWHPPSLATVERVLAVAAGEAKGTEVGGGWRVDRSGQRLRLHRAAPEDER
ncbi:MAG: tRNA lysidine(34) synthetase TilS [Acidimicrobiales bacterium]